MLKFPPPPFFSFSRPPSLALLVEEEARRLEDRSANESTCARPDRLLLARAHARVSLPSSLVVLSLRQLLTSDIFLLCFLRPSPSTSRNGATLSLLGFLNGLADAHCSRRWMTAEACLASEPSPIFFRPRSLVFFFPKSTRINKNTGEGRARRLRAPSSGKKRDGKGEATELVRRSGCKTYVRVNKQRNKVRR